MDLFMGKRVVSGRLAKFLRKKVKSNNFKRVKNWRRSTKTAIYNQKRMAQKNSN